jgi:hypothetical protein
MKSASEIDALRDRAILSSLAGFPFLLVFALVWIAAGALSYVVPRDIAPWIYVLLGMPAAPIAITLERRLGYVPAAKPDPLLPLTLQIFFVQIVAFPAILLVWDAAPEYVPVAFAAVVGAHFLPFQWIYCTSLYGFWESPYPWGRLCSRCSLVRARCITRGSSWVVFCFSGHSSRDPTRKRCGSNRSKMPNHLLPASLISTGITTGKA